MAATRKFIRRKSDLRNMLEDFFKEESKKKIVIENVETDDFEWLSIHYENKRELGRIRSMLYTLKRDMEEAKGMIVDVDHGNAIVWIHV